MNTKQKYPMSMIVFHALLAVLMIATLVVGWMMGDNRGLMPLHKSLGALVFIFGVVRIINRMRNMGKIPPSVNHGALHWVEKSVHGLLMVVMLAMPFVGWLISNAIGFPVSVFGLFNLPTLIQKNEPLAHTLSEMHETGAAVFVILLVLHVVGAVYHKIKTKDDVLSRMSPF